MRDISIATAEALGYAIRTRRKAKKMSQLQLAELVGVGRKWVVLLEKGNPTAEMSSVLKTIQVLGLELRLKDPTRPTGVALPSKLDAVFDQLKPTSTKP